MICRRLKIPADSDWLALVNGALTTLIQDWNWEQFGTSTIDETIQTFYQMMTDYTDSTGYCMIGSIFPYMTADPPAGTLICDGAAHARIDYPDLYAALDAAFIVDANYFITPDLRDRTVIGAGDAGGSSTPRTVGEIGGEETHILTTGELASHTHTDAGHSHSYSPPGTTVPVVAPGEAPVIAINLFPGITGTGFAAIQNTGADLPHNNMQPFTALNYCVVAK
jgi:microcystin-dependent protein